MKLMKLEIQNSDLLSLFQSPCCGFTWLYVFVKIANVRYFNCTLLGVHFLYSDIPCISVTLMLCSIRRAAGIFDIWIRGYILGGPSGLNLCVFQSLPYIVKLLLIILV